MLNIDPTQQSTKAVEAIKYTITSNDHKVKLYFLGTNHNFNTINQQEKIDSAFSEYKPNVVIVEGFSSVTKAKVSYKEFLNKMDKDYLYSTRGEITYTITKANDLNLKLIPGEPTDINVYKKVQEKFKDYPKELMFSQFVAKYVNIYLRRKTDPIEVHERIISAIGKFKLATNWDIFDYSPDNFFKIVNKQIKDVLAKDIKELPTNHHNLQTHLKKYENTGFDHNNPNHILDEILFRYIFIGDSKYSSYLLITLRDSELYDKIKRQVIYGKLQYKKTNKEYRILVVTGQKHAKNLENKIRKLMAS